MKRELKKYDELVTNIEKAKAAYHKAKTMRRELILAREGVELPLAACKFIRRTDLWNLLSDLEHDLELSHAHAIKAKEDFLNSQ